MHVEGGVIAGFVVGFVVGAFGHLTERDELKPQLGSIEIITLSSVITLEIHTFVTDKRVKTPVDKSLGESSRLMRLCSGEKEKVIVILPMRHRFKIVVDSHKPIKDSIWIRLSE